MLQDIYPHYFDNTYYINKKIEKTDFVLHYHNNSLLLKYKEDKLEIPRKKDFNEITDFTFVFTLDNTPCYLVWDDLIHHGNDFIYKEISFFRTTHQQEIAWVGLVGFNLSNWYLNNKFCGKCGTQTTRKPDERAIFCTTCNTTIYPKISPAIIVAITCKNKILLAKNTNFPNGWFSLIAGYVDIGESLEETVKREVKEEIGIDITNIRYYKSQPWPLSSSIMIGFVAEADDNQNICIDNKEIAEAHWFVRGNLPTYSSRISIAGEMIEKFDKGIL